MFRCLDENEVITFDKDKIIIFAHPELYLNGNPVEIAAGKIIAVRKLVNPETEAQLVQVTLKCKFGMCSLKLSETNFDKLKPLCVHDKE